MRRDSVDRLHPYCATLGLLARPFGPLSTDHWVARSTRLLPALRCVMMQARSAPSADHALHVWARAVKVLGRVGTAQLATLVGARFVCMGPASRTSRASSRPTGNRHLGVLDSAPSHTLRFPPPSFLSSVRRQSNRDHEGRFVRDTLQPVGCVTPLADSSVSVV
jgi:hypothetical protein